MFERFTAEARQTVVDAQIEARQQNSGRIGSEHLLLALLRQEGTPSAAVLARHGVTYEAVAESLAGYFRSDLDAEALTTLGIHLAAVRDRVEATFGQGALDGPRSGGAPDGHIPFTPRAKKVLELALREAIAGKSKSITDGHILLGVLREGEGLAMKVLADRGVDITRLRGDVRAGLGY